MKTNKYGSIGVAAYISMNDLNAERLHVFNQAIELKHNLFADIVAPDEAKLYENVMRSAEFLHLMENTSFCTQSYRAFSPEMPAMYADASVTTMTAKGVPMLRLYIPVSTATEAERETFVHGALIPVLTKLFGADLLAVKTREAELYGMFPEESEKVVLSVDRFKAKELVMA